MAKNTLTTILLIEDSPTDVRLIKELLLDTSHDSFHVISASTLARGRELLSAHSVGVILLDLGLPDSQGLETFRAVHKDASHLPIIVLTISDDEPLGQQAVREGAQRFVSKDVLTLGAPYAGVFSRMIRFSIEQKRTEAALKTSEEKFRTLFNDSPIAQVHYDVEGRPVEANKAAYTFLGIKSIADIEQWTIFKSPRVPDADKAQLRAGRPIRYELTYDFTALRESKYFPSTHSSVRCADVHVAPIFSKDGSVSGYLAQIVDITDHKHAEEERESIAKFPEENPHPIMRFTPQGTALFKNTAGETLLENPLFPFNDVRGLIGQAYASGKERTNEVTDGAHTFQLIAVPVVDQGYVNVYGTDITERKRAEETLQQAHEDAQILSEELQSTNEELRTANEELEYRVQERTKELASINQELGVSNEELRHETDARTKAEAAARTHAHHLDILNRVIKAGNEAKTLQTTLSAMVSTAVELTNFDGGLIFLLNEAEGVAELQYEEGCPPHFVEAHRRVPISLDTGAHYYRGEPLFMEDYSELPDGYESEGMTVAAGIPLVSQDKVIGHFGVVSTHPHHFTSQQRDMLVTLGREAGTVIARMQAEEAVKEHAKRTAALNEIIRVLNEAPDVPALYERGLATMIPHLRFESGIITTASENGQLVVQHALNLPTSFVNGIAGLSITASPYLRALYEHGELFVQDVQPTDSIGYRLGQRGATVSIPFMSEGKVIGHVGMHATSRRSFIPDDRELFQAVGREFGTALARLRAKDGLSESEARHRSLVERNFDGVIIHSDGIIRFANKAAARISKVSSPDELIGKSAFEISTPEYRELLTQRVQEIYRTHESSDLIEIQMNARDGTIVDLELSGTFITYEGRPAIYVVARDISERKQMEAQLKQYADHLKDLVAERTAQLEHSEEEFRTVFEASSVGQIRYDADGQPMRINRAAATFFGINDVSDIQHLTIFSSPATSEENKARLRAGRPVRYEHVYDFNAISERGSFRTTRSDVRYADLYMLPIFSTSGDSVEGYLAQIADITERKEAEAALQDAERLAGIGQTAAMIGHDLRNPLQGLQYIVDLQKLRFERMPPDKRSTKDWDKEQVLFDRISEQVFYMDKIVGDLQDYARPITPEHEEITLRTIIDDVLESLPPTDGVETVINVSNLTFVADTHLMLRVFSNLFLNAIQAMPQGGTLTISAKAADGSVAVHVSDTGVGIPADMRDKVFSPLTTGKAKGTGLGLAVVKRIVEAHNGTITFESEEGEGTTFTVTLPHTIE
ncbi:MAG: PAS domain S-box protein [Halobacteriota archaeon]